MKPADETQEQPKLTNALRRANQVALLTPASVDERIRSAARAHFQAVSQPKIVPLRVWLAMAASIMLLLGSVWFWRGTEQAMLRALNNDLDGNGVVDVVDAMLLAEWIESSNDNRLRHDQNKDGRIDQLDVEQLAQRAVAVALEEKSGS